MTVQHESHRKHLMYDTNITKTCITGTVVAYVNAGCLHTTLYMNSVNKKILAPKVIFQYISGFRIHLQSSELFFISVDTSCLSVSLQDFSFQMLKLRTACSTHCLHHCVTACYL